MITARYDINDLVHKKAELWHHIAGLQYTSSGYGKRIPTPYLVKLPGGKRWRRVYACCFSNTCTTYVETGKDDWAVITGSVK